MAAAQTVPQSFQHCNFTEIIPRQGVVTLFGYGINVHVDRGHLTIRDGIGSQRRFARFPRVGHGLKRLVVIGSDGVVSLAALRWLADQRASFFMLDRLGRVLATTGPVYPSDARLRRAQSLAEDSGAAMRIAVELIKRKLLAQEKLVREQFQNTASAEIIADQRLKSARSIVDQVARNNHAPFETNSVRNGAHRRRLFVHNRLPHKPWRVAGGQKIFLDEGNRRRSVSRRL